MSKPYIFQAVFNKLVENLGQHYIQELSKFQLNNNSTTLRYLINFFEIFTRQLPYYSSAISTLAKTASYGDVSSIFIFLTKMIIAIRRGNYSLFKKITLPHNFSNVAKFFKELIQCAEMLFISDLLCVIIYSTEFDQTINTDYLINCGIEISMNTFSTNTAGIGEKIMAQWAAIYSYLSKYCSANIYTKISNYVINKADSFFVLLSLMRLDSPGCPYDDLLELVISLTKRSNNKRKNLTLSMLSSISSFILTYPGDVNNLKYFKKLSESIESDNFLYPGALELNVILMIKFGTKKEEIDLYCKNNIFPLAKNSKYEMEMASRTFLHGMFNFDINPDFLYCTWGQYNNDIKNQENVNSFYSIDLFLENFYEATYYETCKRNISNILYYLALNDMNQFVKKIVTKYTNFSSDDKNGFDRFSMFISIVPKIYDYKQKNNISDVLLQQFFEKISNIIDSNILGIGWKKTFGTQISNEQFQPFFSTIETSTVSVGNLFTNTWGINTGKSIQQICSNTQSIQSVYYLNAFKILPYLLQFQAKYSDNYIEKMILLALASDPLISKLGYIIFCMNLKNPEKRDKIIKYIIQKINIHEKHPVIFVCLSLLYESLDELEPDQPNEIRYQIEFSGFLGLASEHPMVRIMGNKILIKINKLLQGGGFYGYLEPQMQAIESNVTHNILLSKIPKSPTVTEFNDEYLNYNDALSSRYQYPWLYFLAELGKVILSVNYYPLLEKIAKLTNTKNVFEKHFEVGILVIFVSTSRIDNIYDSQDIYLLNKFSDQQITPFAKNVLNLVFEIINNDIYKYEKQSFIFKVLRHANTSLISKIFKHLSPINTNQVSGTNYRSLAFSNSRSVPNLSAIKKQKNDNNYWKRILRLVYYYLRYYEENGLVKDNIYFALFEILSFCFDKVKDYFSSELKNDKEMAYKKFKNDKDLEISSNAEKYLIRYLYSIENLFDSHKSIISNESMRLKIFILLLNILELKSKHFKKIQRYASFALYKFVISTKILEDDSKIISYDNISIIKVMAKAESLGFHVLSGFLENHMFFLKTFVDACFKLNQTISDFFFDSIYYIFSKDKDSPQEMLKEEMNNFQKLIGPLFLVGLFQLQKGSVNAKNFLQLLSLIYISTYLKSQEFDEIKEALYNSDNIVDTMVQNFGERVAELIVKEGFIQLESKKFKGNLKIIVDVLIPLIKMFR